jgi:hypothetical protein
MKLFKYVEPQRVDILENGKIAFTPPGRFKDPFEFRPELAGRTVRALLKDTIRQHENELITGADGMSARQLKRARKTLLRTANHEGVLEKTKDSFTRTIATRADSDFGVLCLSSVENDNLMWYHYADGHRGFVIEFDSEQPEFRKVGKPWKIEYVVSQPVYDHRVGNLDFFRFKPKYLEFEKEFRIIRPLKECTVMKDVGRNPLYFWPLPLICVKAVYLGHRLGHEFRDRLMKALTGTDVKIFETVIARENYKLMFREIGR